MTNDTPKAGSDQADLTVPAEVLDLLRFMCQTWTAIDTWARENCAGDGIDTYPVIQGTGNQIRLMRIGRQPFDPKSLRPAIDWMQRFNPPVDPAAGGPYQIVPPQPLQLDDQQPQTDLTETTTP